MLSLHSKKLSISPISAFRPRRWKGKIINDGSKITITNLNSIKRPAGIANNRISIANEPCATKKITVNILIKTVVIEARETYFVKKIIAMPMHTIINAGNGASATKPPNADATPLPPLNDAKIGQQ